MRSRRCRTLPSWSRHRFAVLGGRRRPGDTGGRTRDPTRRPVGSAGPRGRGTPRREHRRPRIQRARGVRRRAVREPLRVRAFDCCCRGAVRDREQTESVFALESTGGRCSSAACGSAEPMQLPRSAARARSGVTAGSSARTGSCGSRSGCGRSGKGATLVTRRSAPDRCPRITGCSARRSASVTQADAVDVARAQALQRSLAIDHYAITLLGAASVTSPAY